MESKSSGGKVDEAMIRWMEEQRCGAEGDLYIGRVIDAWGGAVGKGCKCRLDEMLARGRHPTTHPKLIRFPSSLCYGYEILQEEKFTWNRPDEIRMQ